MIDGEVAIRTGGATLSGWKRVRIHRSCEQAPNTFEVGFVSDSTDGVGSLVKAGDPCTVEVGGEVVLTGYVDLVDNDADKAAHDLTMAGRGKCADLVDCSAELPDRGCIINGETVQGVATKLAKPYGIKVLDPPKTVQLPTFGVTLIETAFALIEEIARYAQFLVFENAKGELVFADVGEKVAKGSLVWGENIERARVRQSMEDRYSEYVCYISATDQFADLGMDPNVRALDQDEGVKRHRRLGMVLEAPTGAPQQDFADKRIQWERARRAGRSNQATVTVPGWRDGGGALWEPNTRVRIQLPKHGLSDVIWVIGDATYIRDDEGTRTELMLMPPAAFQPQPEQLVDPLVDLYSSTPPGAAKP